MHIAFGNPLAGIVRVGTPRVRKERMKSTRFSHRVLCEALEPRQLLSITPVGVGAMRNVDGTAAISWQAGSNAADAYQIEIKDMQTGENFHLVSGVAGTTFSAQLPTSIVISTHEYTVNVRALAGAASEYGAAVLLSTVNTTLPAPGGLQSFDEFGDVLNCNFSWGWSGDPLADDPIPFGNGVYADGYYFDMRVTSDANRFAHVYEVYDITSEWWNANGSEATAPSGGPYLGYFYGPWPGTFAVQVQARGPGNARSPWSDSTTIIVEGEVCPAPTNVTAEENAGGGVTLNWSWSGGENWTPDGFQIYGIDASGALVDINYADGSTATLDLPANPGVASYYVNAGAYKEGTWNSYSWSADSELAANPGTAAPAAPSGVSPHLIDRNKVRVLWNNIPNSEETFLIQKKLHTDSTWSNASTVGADVTTADVTLSTDPQEWTKLWDIRVVASNARGNSASGAVQTSGIALQSVSFGGTGFQSVTRDRGGDNAVYVGPQWYDLNMNGNIDRVVGDPQEYSNKTIDGTIEHRFPISYVRSVPASPEGATPVVPAAPSFVNASPIMVFNGSVGVGWKLKGEGGGLMFTADVAVGGGGFLWSNLQTVSSLPQIIDSKEVEIIWKLSTDGVSYFDVGTSKTHLYVTGSAASAAFETVLDLGCFAAEGSGKRPGNPGEATADVLVHEREVVDAVWPKFSGNSTRRVDKTLMTYTHLNDAGTGEPFATTYTEMLNSDHALGQCTAWAGLLVASVQIHGISGQGARIDAPTADAAAPGGYQLKTRSVCAQGTGSNFYGFDVFKFHQVVKFRSFPDRIFDPSYGVYSVAPVGVQAEVAYESQILIGFQFFNASTNQMQIKPDRASKRDCVWDGLSPEA